MILRYGQILNVVIIIETVLQWTFDYLHTSDCPKSTSTDVRCLNNYVRKLCLSKACLKVLGRNRLNNSCLWSPTVLRGVRNEVKCCTRFRNFYDFRKISERFPNLFSRQAAALRYISAACIEAHRPRAKSSKRRHWAESTNNYLFPRWSRLFPPALVTIFKKSLSTLC